MSEPTSRVYLLLPGDATPAIADTLQQMLQVTKVAAILLWSPGRDDEATGSLVGAVCNAVHPLGVPVLIGGVGAVIQAFGADGIHAEGDEKMLKAIVATHAPARMVGAGNIWNKHDAMLRGEGHVDYVLFGSADPARSIDAERIAGLSQWWSEVFEVPCIAMAGSQADARAAIDAGADFVAVRDCIWAHEQGPVAGLAALDNALREEEPA